MVTSRPNGFVCRPCGVLLLTLALCPSPPRASADTPETTVHHLPFDPQPLERLRASPRKVFAHYFTPFPLRITPEPWAEDYYALHYLSPSGEHGKFAGKGGYLRERPLPRPATDQANWRELDLREEIRRAAALGIDGFSWNMLTLDRTHHQWLQGVSLLDAASATAPEFRIMLMPDMAAIVGSDNDVARDLAVAIEALSAHPSVFRLDDGRLVVCPFLTENRSPEFWKDWLEEMTERGVDIALVALFQGWKGSVTQYRSILHGVSDWGWREAKRARVWYGEAERAHENYGLLWMMPVAPQDFRPKSSTYWEAGNSEHFRVMWDAAIQSDTDWVQLISWNDYSEHTEIAPSTGIQWSFYDLTAFFTEWFKTGRQPEIVRDVLFYFHRIHPADAPRDSTLQPESFSLSGSQPARDEIELLAFLKAPGVLRISVDGVTKKRKVGAGLHSFKVPLRPGRPRFRLKRKGRTIIDFQSRFEIQAETIYQDMLYRGGSSTRELAAEEPSPASWGPSTPPPRSETN